MANHSVTLPVTPFLRIECKFWLVDDGWKGSCEQCSINVQAGSFEYANLKWKWPSGNIWSLFSARPNHPAQAKLRNEDMPLLSWR